MKRICEVCGSDRGVYLTDWFGPRRLLCFVCRTGRYSVKAKEDIRDHVALWDLAHPRRTPGQTEFDFGEGNGETKAIGGSDPGRDRAVPDDPGHPA